MLPTVLHLVAGTYFLLTSLYCLLAFLPYTYCAFIKAPPYPWMPWFAHHQSTLYWMAAVLGFGSIHCGSRSYRGKKAWRLAVVAAIGIAIGLYLSVHPFLPGLQSNRAAYWWSLGSLLPL